jgi:hypothetical protein
MAVDGRRTSPRNPGAGSAEEPAKADLGYAATKEPVIRSKLLRKALSECHQ